MSALTPKLLRQSLSGARRTKVISHNDVPKGTGGNEMNRMHVFIAKRPGTLRVALMLAFMVAVGFSGAFAAETGTNLPWEGPLTTLVTSLTGPVAYAISVIAIVALGATLAFRGGEMGETMRHLLQAGIAVCLVVFAAQVMTSFIGQSAEIAILQPVHVVARG
jgi:type IV secretion system protein TrbC